MRMARWGVAVVAVITLGACQRHESLTGLYGAGVISGQVVMGAGTSASPEGVRVSVVGTGMSTLLGSDGRFVFANAPEKADLHFTRADGIDARLSVTAKGPLVVELNGSSASAGRRRAAAPAAQLQIEGDIVTPGTDSIVVHSSHNEDVKVLLTDSTVIRHGQTPIAAADLKAGDHVHVKATVKDDVRTAIEVIVQDEGEEEGGGDANTMTANGTVKSVGSDSLVGSTVPKGDVTVQVTAETIIRKQGVLIGIADIHQGDEVNTMGTPVDDHTLKARQIEVRGKGKSRP